MNDRHRFIINGSNEGYADVNCGSSGSSRLRRFLYTVIMITVFLVLMAAAGVAAEPAGASQLKMYFSSTDGSACHDIADGDYFTTEYFNFGTEVTITCDAPISYIYILWEDIPGEWTLKVNGGRYTYGKDGYLHELVKLPAEAGTVNSVTIMVEAAKVTVADVYAFSDGELPGFVQDWQDPYEEADILLIATHADDEALFYGGIIPDYTDKGDVRVQVAYFTDQFQSESYRNHEILNSLWTMGVTHYPQLGEFYDHYSESYEEAEEQYDYNRSLEYITKTIRRFKPQVLVGQDLSNGEYGHGAHMWCARVMADALEITGNPNKYPDSAAVYGTWDVPKAYFHLYENNVIELDARVPLESFEGKTGLEVARLAYLEHQSQQWCWFYVSDGYDEDGNPDGYESSCTRYGLYRTLVGADTGNDLMEHLTTYDEQARAMAAKNGTLTGASGVNGSEKSDASGAIIADGGTDGEGVYEDIDGTYIPAAKSVLDVSSPTTVPGGKNTTAITILVIMAIIIFLIIVGIVVVSVTRSRIRKKEWDLERTRVETENRMRGRYTRNVSRNAPVYRSGSGVRNTSPGYNYRNSGNPEYSGRYRSESGGGYRG